MFSLFYPFKFNNSNWSKCEVYKTTTVCCCEHGCFRHATIEQTTADIEIREVQTKGHDLLIAPDKTILTEGYICSH